MTRALLFALIAFIALSPIVWIRPFGNTLALFHVAGVVMLSLLLFQRRTIEGLSKALGRGKLIWLPCAVLLFAMVLSLAKAGDPYSMGDITKYAGYLAFAIGSAVATVVLIRADVFRYLYIAPLVSVVVLALFTSVSLAAAGIDFFSTFARAVSEANPNLLIFPLFKGMFVAELGEVMANLRHGMAQAMLCSALVGIAGYCFMEKTPVVRVITWGGVAMAMAVVLFSFSRSAWLAAALAGMILSAQMLENGKRLFIALNLSIGGLMVLSVLPIGQMVVARLEASQSYTARFEASSGRWQEIGDNLWWGSSYPPAVKAHNLFVDYWASSGALGAVAAFALILAVTFFAMRTALLSATEPKARRLLMATISGMMFMPLTRYFTAPDGLPQVGTWIALGVGVGLIALCTHPVRVRLFQPSYGSYGRYGGSRA